MIPPSIAPRERVHTSASISSSPCNGFTSVCTWRQYLLGGLNPWMDGCRSDIKGGQAPLGWMMSVGFGWKWAWGVNEDVWRLLFFAFCFFSFLFFSFFFFPLQSDNVCMACFHISQVHTFFFHVGSCVALTNVVLYLYFFVLLFFFCHSKNDCIHFCQAWIWSSWSQSLPGGHWGRKYRKKGKRNEHQATNWLSILLLFFSFFSKFHF